MTLLIVFTFTTLIFWGGLLAWYQEYYNGNRFLITRATFRSFAFCSCMLAFSLLLIQPSHRSGDAFFEIFSDMFVYEFLPLEILVLSLSALPRFQNIRKKWISSDPWIIRSVRKNKSRWEPFWLGGSIALDLTGILFSLFLLTSVVVNTVDRAFPKGKKTIYTAKVIDRKIHKGYRGSHTYFFILKYENGRTKRLDTDWDGYTQTALGSSVRFVEGEGLFGYPFYYSVDFFPPR